MTYYYVYPYLRSLLHSLLLFEGMDISICTNEHFLSAVTCMHIIIIILLSYYVNKIKELPRAYYLLLLKLLEGTRYGYVRSYINLQIIIIRHGHAVNLHDSMSEECHTHLVSLIKHHGLFVPYIVTKIFF